jgi:hypothetical protein
VEVITAKPCVAEYDVGRSSSIRLYIRNLDADWIVETFLKVCHI